MRHGNWDKFVRIHVGNQNRNTDNIVIGENMIPQLISGIVSGVLASIIVLLATDIMNYRVRMKTERCKVYQLEYIGARDAMAPPEYTRETAYIDPPHEEGVSEEFYEMVDIVRLQFPFDIKEISVLENGVLVYPTDDLENLPSGESVYVVCKLSLGDDIPAFVVRCKTFKHEYREYEYSTIYKYSGGMSGFGLKMTKQSFVW